MKKIKRNTLGKIRKIESDIDVFDIFILARCGNYNCPYDGKRVNLYWCLHRGRH